MLFELVYPLNLTHLQIQEVKDGWAYVIARILIYDKEKADHPDECATLVVREYQGYVKIIGGLCQWDITKDCLIT